MHLLAHGSRRRSMSTVDEPGVAMMSEDGEAEDSALRALRDDQAKLDDAWNKKEAGAQEVSLP